MQIKIALCPGACSKTGVSLAACLMLKDSEAFFLPHSTFITLAGYTGKQLASVSAAYFAWSHIITGYVVMFGVFVLIQCYDSMHNIAH